LLDEPFTALDTGLRQAVREDVRTALHTAGATAVLVTHDQQEALSMAEVVSVLREGRIVQAAAPNDLYTAPVDMAVATFVGEAVVLEAVLAGGYAECVLGRLPVRTDAAAANGGGSAAAGPGTVVIRPEQIVVGSSGHGVPARVAGTRYFGHDALISFVVTDSGRADAAEIVARVQGGRLPGAGTEVGLTVAGEVSFFRP
jgi:iron(III) transport system ATP-binding protein